MVFKGPYEGPFEKKTIDVKYSEPLEHTRKRLDQLEGHEVIPWGYFAIGDVPMTSFSFCSCRALVLKSDGLVGMSHIYGYNDDPEFYLREMLKELPAGEVSGYIVSQTLKSSDVEKACEGHRVKIKEVRQYDSERDLIVIPSAKEIEIFTPGLSIFTPGQVDKISIAD